MKFSTEFKNFTFLFFLLCSFSLINPTNNLTPHKITSFKMMPNSESLLENLIKIAKNSLLTTNLISLNNGGNDDKSLKNAIRYLRLKLKECIEKTAKDQAMFLENMKKFNQSMHETQSLKHKIIYYQTRNEIKMKSIDGHILSELRLQLNNQRVVTEKLMVEVENHLQLINIKESLLKARLPTSSSSCGLLTNCRSCTANNNCGWCGISQTCMEGDSTGPKEGSCMFFDYNKCSGPKDCENYTSCGECLEDASCGWCNKAGNPSCMKKDAVETGNCRDDIFSQKSRSLNICPHIILKALFLKKLNEFSKKINPKKMVEYRNVTVDPNEVKKIQNELVLLKETKDNDQALLDNYTRILKRTLFQIDVLAEDERNFDYYGLDEERVKPIIYRMAYRIFNLLLRYYSNQHISSNKRSFNFTGEDEDDLYQENNNFSSTLNTSIYHNKNNTLITNNNTSLNNSVMMNSTLKFIKSSHVRQVVNTNNTVVKNYNKLNNQTLPSLDNTNILINGSKNTSKISISLKHNKIKQPLNKKMLNISNTRNSSHNLLNKSSKITKNNKILNKPLKMKSNKQSHIILIGSIFNKNSSNFSINSNITNIILSNKKMNKTNNRKKEENFSEIFRLMNEYKEISKSLFSSSDPLTVYNKFKAFHIKNTTKCKPNVMKSTDFHKNFTNSSLISHMFLHNKTGRNKALTKNFTIKNKVNISIHISNSSNLGSHPGLKNFTILKKIEVHKITHLTSITNPILNTTLKNDTINETKIAKEKQNISINEGKKKFKKLKSNMTNMTIMTNMKNMTNMTNVTNITNNYTINSTHKNITKHKKEKITKFKVDFNIFKNNDGLEKMQKVEDENDVYNDFRITELAEVEKEPIPERRFLK